MSELPQPTRWLIRIPEVFAPFRSEILTGLGVESERAIGREYLVVKAPELGRLQDSPAAKYLLWNLPIHHAWPCVPQKMENFVEKAAQGIASRFAGSPPQALLTGALQTSATHPLYRHLATNLRGRTLQLFPTLPAAKPEDQDPALPSLFCLVGKEGLFCGLQSPKDSDGFYPGGTRFIKQSGKATISRAGAKIAEALHYLLLHRAPLAEGSRWLELGASPGGMTSELLRRGFHVTAIDRAPMDPRLMREKNLEIVRADVLSYSPALNEKFDAILCDLNGDPRESIRAVVRLAKDLNPGGLVVFTLKLPNADSLAECEALYQTVTTHATRTGLKLLARTHLTYNRMELTLFFEPAD